jgi:DNA-binding transcriptional MerR regulator
MRGLQRPREVADDLGIAPSTLRLWSTEFAEFLSTAAAKRDGALGQRRYADEDRRVLRRVGELLAREGASDYEQVRRRLLEEGFAQRALAPTPEPRASRADDGAAIRALEEALVRAEQAIAARDGAIAYRDDTIAGLERTVERLRQTIARLEEARAGDRESRVRLAQRVGDLTEECRRLRAELARPWWERLRGVR